MVSVVDITQRFRMVSVVGSFMVSVVAGNFLFFVWFPSLFLFMVSVAAGNIFFLWFPSRNVLFVLMVSVAASNVVFYRGK